MSQGEIGGLPGEFLVSSINGFKWKQKTILLIFKGKTAGQANYKLQLLPRGDGKREGKRP